MSHHSQGTHLPTPEARVHSSPTPPPTTTTTTTTETAPTTTTTTYSVSQQSSPRSARDEVDNVAISGNKNNNNNNNNNHQKAGTSREMPTVRYGKCKWFNVAKGWGFITPNDGGQEVFVHQSVIQMTGFRSLGEQEEVEFECKQTERGLEATRVSGRQGIDCHGSTYRPRTKKRFRRIRCYNCGEFANHIASKCVLGPQPKRCHLCKQEDHLFADCPMKQTQTSEVSSSAGAESGRVGEDSDT